MVTVAAPKVRQDWQLVIGGQLTASSSGERLVTLNPATEEPLAEVPAADERDVARAVAAAKTAFGRWRQIDVRERARMIRGVAEHMRNNIERYALLEALDVGSPYTSLKTDVLKGIDHLEYFAGICMETKGETIPAS